MSRRKKKSSNWKWTHARKRVHLRNRFKGQITMIEKSAESILRDTMTGSLTGHEAAQVFKLQQIAKRMLEGWNSSA